MSALPAAETTSRPSQRRLSLDIARGLMLIASVGVDSWLTLPVTAQHARWAGINAVDIIFPVFVTLSGAGLGYAYSRRVPAGPTLRRCVVLLLVGFLYNAIIQYGATANVSFATLRLTGVLQLYAVLVLVLAGLHLLTRSWRGWLLLTMVFALIYTGWLMYFAVRCPVGELTPTCNPSGRFDPLIFGSRHLYGAGAAGHDPEGVFAILGALVSASVGATGAHLLNEHRRRPSWPLVGRMALTIAVFGTGAWLSSQVTITAKRLWTPPFGLTLSLLTVCVLWIVALALDYWRKTPTGIVALTYPLVALGRNSLLVYFGSHILMYALSVSGPLKSDRSWADQLAASLSGDAGDVTRFVIVTVLFWTILSSLMHWKRIYLRP